MPTKISLNCDTGEAEEVEMEGEELATFAALRAVQEPEPKPSRDERLLAAVEQATALTG